ncbi:hypothetical protein D3878_19470 [Noviherbaspirillum sedimenti]|uniref:Uncharacterized protein n=1 Tax=Noviherbaspirillum sedimenti TaxID=2320865 RepID=A0A3A3G783_9BURK|nr:hypothetical protein D3878_19470 [Noviherbaspirillum sedimenti]
MMRFGGCIACIAGIRGRARHPGSVMMVAMRRIAVIVMVMRIAHQGNLHCLLVDRPTRHAHGTGCRMKR